jgi:PAS domain S-box-containing protein
MSKDLSSPVCKFREHCVDVRRNVEAAVDPQLKADVLYMEKRCMALAHYYASMKSLFSAAMSGSERKPDSPAPTEANRSLRLQEISALLIQEGNLDVLYERVVEAAIGVMSSDMGSMQTFHPEHNELRLLAWKGFHPQSAAFWKRVHLDSACTCGVALTAGRRVIVSDTAACDFMADTGDLDAYRRSNIRAVQSTPLVSRSGRLLGMISTHWREPHQPTERALRSLDVLARQAADLIERTQVEAALRKSEERFRWLASIVESSDDAIIGKSLDGIITSWNKGAERLFGYMAEEVVGKPITILIPPDRYDEERTILERIKRGEAINHYETVRHRKDGSSIVISLAISPVKDAEGRIVGASKIARDITEQKRAEAREKGLMAELTYMDRRKSAEQRSATLVHEISQPLAGIAARASAALRWLRMEKPEIEKAQTALESIVDATDRASDIIVSVGAMFKKGTSERAPIDINRIILTVLGLVRIDLKQNGVELKTQLDEKASVVEGDKVQLQQVVLNLVMNGVEAMRSVQTRVLKVQTHQTNPSLVRVSIEDTGTGIDPSNIDRVFKPFFTTKANGMGMGLVICRSIIEEHEGRIWVSRGVNGGSVFQFELPTKSPSDRRDTMPA